MKQHPGKRLEKEEKRKKNTEDVQNQSFLKRIWKEYGYLVVTVLSVLFIFRILLQLAWVPSGSMETSIPTDSLVISWRLPYLLADPVPERGDVVTFWSDELDKLLVKRVVAKEKDSISFQDGYTYINGEKTEEDYLPTQGITYSDKTFEVPEKCFFAMGDNRTASKDSRLFENPYIPVHEIRAHSFLCIPFSYWNRIPYPQIRHISILTNVRNK